VVNQKTRKNPRNKRDRIKCTLLSWDPCWSLSDDIASENIEKVKIFPLFVTSCFQGKFQTRNYKKFIRTDFENDEQARYMIWMTNLIPSSFPYFRAKLKKKNVSFSFSSPSFLNGSKQKVNLGKKNSQESRMIESFTSDNLCIRTHLY